MSRPDARLPLSFHMTFQPERHYLTALLKFAEKHTTGTIDGISQATGIPTGKSTGKVKPLLQYAQGMGLLELGPTTDSLQQFVLTPFAHAILREDPHLLEENTQWALHLMLCGRRGGAEVWYAVFVEAAGVVGREFTEQQFEQFLSNRYGSSRDAVGPLFRTYADSAALAKAAAIACDDGQIALRRVPTQPALIDTVAGLLILAWDETAPNDSQVALTTLEATSGLLAATGWRLEDQSQLLTDMESRGLLHVDRQTGNPILTRLVSTDHVLRMMYDRLV